MNSLLILALGVGCGIVAAALLPIFDPSMRAAPPGKLILRAAVVGFIAVAGNVLARFLFV